MITIAALPVTLGLIGLAGGPRPVVLAILLAADFLEGVALTIFNIQAATLRQTSAEPDTLARVAATWTVWSYTAWSIGAVAGGVIASYTGLRPVIVGAGFVAITATPLLRSRISSRPTSRAKT